MSYALRVLACLGLGACGTSHSATGSGGGAPLPAGCAVAPGSCEQGLTCGLDKDGAFACLEPGEAGVGDDCKSYLGFPACQRDLVCVQASATELGACARQCEVWPPSCDGGERCVLVESALGATIGVCQPSGDSETGGAGGGGTGGGSETGGAGGGA